MMRGEIGEGRRTRGAVVRGAIGVGLIVVWVAWWVQSVRQDSLLHGGRTWVGPLPFLAGDFKVHIDHVARIQVREVNAYLIKDDPACAMFPYPPMIPRLFAWVTAFSPAQAAAVWQGAVALFLGMAAYAAWRMRQEMGLWPVPLAVMAAALMYSTPAVMAMERGQCDPLVIPAVLAVAWLARGRGTRGELAAGGLLGVTAWLKYYPGLAVFGLLALRQWKAAAAFVVVAGLIGVYDRAEVRRSIENGKYHASEARKQPIVHAESHSIVSSWRAIPLVRQVRPLRKIPPPVAAAFLLLPVIAVVSYQVARSRNPGPLLAPYLLWLTAAATFGMPYAIDYNLVSLPLVALCVWDRRDPVIVHVAMGLFLLWWQPIAINVGGEVLLVAKIAALYAVGHCLKRRAAEVSRLEFTENEHGANRRVDQPRAAHQQARPHVV